MRPVGVPAADVTAKAKATDWPKAEGFTEDVTVVVVDAFVMPSGPAASLRARPSSPAKAALTVTAVAAAPGEKTSGAKNARHRSIAGVAAVRSRMRVRIRTPSGRERLRNRFRSKRRTGEQVSASGGDVRSIFVGIVYCRRRPRVKKSWARGT